MASGMTRIPMAENARLTAHPENTLLIRIILVSPIGF
jgi:hypothetical protein